jgi:hypothetical protein
VKGSGVGSCTDPYATPNEMAGELQDADREDFWDFDHALRGAAALRQRRARVLIKKTSEQ